MSGRSPGFNEKELREAVAISRSWAETLRNLGQCSTGGSRFTARKYAAKWGIDTSHFDPDAARRQALARPKQPLEDILVANSTFSRGHLKRRLYDEGLKDRRCEMCGQGEEWRGATLALILDHINGVRDDHRLENLRIVCPNCAATLPTHCGKGLRKPRSPRACGGCALEFIPRFNGQRFCSRECGQRAGKIPAKGVARPETRKVDRPPYEELVAEIEKSGFSAVGRKHGVSDAAVRKWVQFYERQRDREAAESGEADGGSADEAA